MYRFTVDELARAVGGTTLDPGPEGATYSLSTDTRALGSGQIFVAIKGERFDGHDFLDRVLAVEGCGVLGEGRRLIELTSLRWMERPRIAVEDPTHALGLAARHVRRRAAIPIVAVTGTAGKTTTRELVRCVLAAGFGEVLASEGNLNNHVGLPLTLLRLTPRHRAAVVELGMSNAGEIRALSLIAEPEVRLITNVGRAHLITLGDEAGVARAKGELFETARPGDRLVVNLDDARVAALRRPDGVEVIGYGRHAGARVRLVAEAGPGDAFRVRADGREVTVQPTLVGAHNRLNATAALAVAVALGIDLEAAAQSLASARVEPMRMERVALPGGVQAVNDAYNANPESMAAALKACVELVPPGGRLVAALGDMLELGPLAVASHRELGAAAARAGVALLFAAGPHAEDVAAGAREAGMDAGRIVTRGDPTEVAPVLGPALAAGDVLLIKGSRGMRMERVLAALRDGVGGQG